MKALKSDFAKKVMSDPEVKRQMREFNVSRSGIYADNVIKLKLSPTLYRETQHLRRNNMKLFEATPRLGFLICCLSAACVISVVLSATQII